MTKFSDEFKEEVKDFWQENKGKVKGKEVTGVHMKRMTEKKFSMQDVADHFGLTISQANRIVYVKKGESK